MGQNQFLQPKLVQRLISSPISFFCGLTMEGQHASFYTNFLLCKLSSLQLKRCVKVQKNKRVIQLMERDQTCWILLFHWLTHYWQNLLFFFLQEASFSLPSFLCYLYNMSSSFSTDKLCGFFNAVTKSVLGDLLHNL